MFYNIRMIGLKKDNATNYIKKTKIQTEETLKAESNLGPKERI